MYRRLHIFFCALLMLVVFAAPALATPGAAYQGHPTVNIVINGQQVQGDVPAILMDGRALVPLRALSEALGLDIRWDAATNTVYMGTTTAGPTPTPPPAPGDKVIKIGFMAPLTGDLQSFGESMKKGSLLALEERQYKVGDFKIEFVMADDRNDATEAVNMAQKLITRDKVTAIVGPLTSKNSIPVSELAHHFKVPVITPVATNPKVTMDNGRRKEYMFRACFIDPLQGDVAARFALDNLKLKTAAVLYDQGNNYSLELAENFKKAFEKNGGRVLVHEAYSSMDVDFSPVLTRVAAQKPDILYLPDYYMKVNQIGKQAREKGIKPVFLGSDGWDSMDLDFVAMEDGYFTTHYSPDDPRPEVKKWIERYRKKYGVVPDVFATLSYDATRILLKAIEVSRSNDPDKIKEAMQNLKNFPTVCGSLTFDPNGNPVKPAAIMQIKEGKQVYVTTVMP